VLPGRSEETVTITKARLAELERKEKELDALRSELSKAQGEQEQLRRKKAKVESEKAQLTRAKEAAEARAAAAATTAEPVIVHDTPALTSLPPLKKGAVVDTLDLMNHYRADAAGAEKRYGRQRILVRGVVTGFEKPMFVSHYFITLQSTERNWRIVCHVDPPREFKATYPAQHGEMLVGGDGFRRAHHAGAGGTDGGDRSQPEKLEGANADAGCRPPRGQDFASRASVSAPAAMRYQPNAVNVCVRT
jgi:hypothetical protein